MVKAIALLCTVLLVFVDLVRYMFKCVYVCVWCNLCIIYNALFFDPLLFLNLQHAYSPSRFCTSEPFVYLFIVEL